MGVAVERPDLVDKLVLMGSAGVRAPITDELKAIMNYDYTTDGMVRIIRGLTNPDFVFDDELVNYRHGLSIREDTKQAYNAVNGAGYGSRAAFTMKMTTWPASATRRWW